jgi:hypothetical protein
VIIYSGGPNVVATFAFDHFDWSARAWGFAIFMQIIFWQ